MDRYFSCSFFTTFFLREKESGGKKSAYKGDCAAIRYAPIRRSFPLIYPPDDCSANSENICLYPKRSSGTTTPVSKRKVSRLPPQSFRIGKFVHPNLKYDHTAYFFKGLCTPQWQAKLSVSNYLGHSAREKLPLIKVFARPFSKGRVPPA